MTPKTLVVEGPDRVGKDTLLNRFAAKDPSLLIVANGPPPAPDPLSWCKRRFRAQFAAGRILAQHGVRLAVNRAHLSEFVYGSLFRRYETNPIWDVEVGLEDGLALLVLSDNPATLWARDDQRSVIRTREDTANATALFGFAFQRSDIRDKLLIHCQHRDAASVYYEAAQWLRSLEARA